jgi:hypothetical protein
MASPDSGRNDRSTVACARLQDRLIAAFDNLDPRELARALSAPTSVCVRGVLQKYDGAGQGARLAGGARAAADRRRRPMEKILTA